MPRSGIFLGFTCVLIVNTLIEDSKLGSPESWGVASWRITLATAAIPPIILLFLVFICPESPRFLIRTRQYGKAYRSLMVLRDREIFAARDFYYIYYQQSTEEQSPDNDEFPKDMASRLERIRHQVKMHFRRTLDSFANYIWRIRGLLVKGPNRRACQSASLVMIAQQLCGVCPFPPAIQIDELVFKLNQFHRSTSSRCIHPRWSSRV